MTGPRDDKTPTPKSDEQIDTPIKDLSASETDDNVRGGAPNVSEIVVTKPTDIASTKHTLS